MSKCQQIYKKRLQFNEYAPHLEKKSLHFILNDFKKCKFMFVILAHIIIMIRFTKNI